MLHRRGGFSGKEMDLFDEITTEDFREVTVIPSIQELRSETRDVFLRPNKSQGMLTILILKTASK